LQAQDRCHRLGQKRPVQVFRLVCENTIEEKIVERAQQKLKLDAMVVQQGRLKDKDKVTKEEIMAAVRFGADTVFRSEESTITDDDIDVILARGAAKTKELAEKIQKRDKGNLLDFRLDAGISAQTFEGVDYSDKELRDHLRMLAANTVGKRERRPPPTSYNPIIHTKKSMVVNNRRIKLPKCLRIPQMEDHQFYNRERLLDLGKLEFETYAALREAGQLPPKEIMERQRTLLEGELGQEKLELVAEGFGDWSRSQYYHFVKACAKYGRNDIAAIANDMDKSEEDIASYSKAFWEYGPSELKKEWERVAGAVERGEKKIEKQKKLAALLSQFVSKFDNPRTEMVFANKGTAHFALEQDRALLCAVETHGYGNWDLVREAIRTDSRLKFQHSAQSMSAQTIAKRCDYRMRQMEKELEAREKAMKNKRPVAVVAAYNAIEAIKEADLWDAKARDAQLAGQEPSSLKTVSTEARQVLEERLRDRDSTITRLREIEVQNQRALKMADETRQAIYDSAQYVNYSNIALKPANVPAGGKDDGYAKALKEGIDIEARINREVLSVPACRQCESCNTSNTKLCQLRLEVRNRLLAKEAKPPEVKVVPEKKKPKKRKIVDVPPSTAKKAPPPPAAPTPKAASSGPKKKKHLLMQKPDGQLKVRVTSQGNKRMTIPDDLFPEFCRRISAAGTGERMALINQFVDENPTISARQVTMRLSEITTRERPACVPPGEKKKGPRFMFYLRPAFYKFLPEDERPENWEVYADADEQLYGEEQGKRAAAAAAAENEADSPTPRVSNSETASMVDGEGDETEDDGDDIDDEEEDDDDDDAVDGGGEPDAKRQRVDDE
jgi:SLIDE